jgi:hypothetical protein
MLARLREFVGRDMPIDVEFVAEIPMVRTGKRQGCVSHLGLEFQELRPDEIVRA